MDDVTRALSKGGGGVLVNVQEWGCFSNFLRADDVTRTMSKGGGGGVLVKNPGARCTNSRSGPRTSPKFVKIIPDQLC